MNQIVMVFVVVDGVTSDIRHVIGVRRQDQSVIAGSVDVGDL